MDRVYSHGEGLCLGSRESCPEKKTFMNLAKRLMLTKVRMAVTGDSDVNTDVGCDVEGDADGDIEGDGDW